MERKIGEIFEYNGIRFRVEKETGGCFGCYFRGGNCTSIKPLRGECQKANRSDIGVIFKKVEDMEERTIKLTLEKAKEFYDKGGEFKDLALSAFSEEELTKIELPKTWEEFCSQFKIHGEYYIDTDSSINGDCSGRRSPIFDKNMLPSKKAAEQHLALMQLHQLRDCYRQGWTPNWLDGKAKYCIVHGIVITYLIAAYEGTKAFLSFQSEEIAKLFLKNFRSLIEEAGDLI